MQKILGFLIAAAAVAAAGPAAATAAQVSGSSQPDRASLVVSVPEDARVYLQDQQMRSEGPVRHYISPPLQPGARYTYTMRIEVERDGRTASETLRVPVQAGQRVDLNARLSEGPGGALALNVARPADVGSGTYRSFSFEPGAGVATPRFQPPVFQPPVFQPPSYYQAPSGPQATTRGTPQAGSRIEQRLRPGRSRGR